MAGNLIAPRFEVFWGGKNLMLYSFSGSTQPQPLVIKASVDLVAEGSTPTGTLQWNPSGPAVEVYEELIDSAMSEQIIVRFFYPNGKSIAFAFVWSGQSISYGNDMGIEVKLRSELDGVINANLRSFAQANDSTPVPLQSAIQRLEKQFGVEGMGIVQYTKQSTEDLSKTKVENAYGSNIVFTSALSNMVKANGNLLTASNVGPNPTITITTPYTWEKSPEVINAATVTSQTNPDPTKRYGFILGPAIIDTITRSTEWQPPQQTNVNQPSNTPIPQSKKKETNQNPDSTANTKANENNSKATTAPSGPSNSKSAPNMKLVDNEDGPKKQEMLNKEKQSKLSANLFMCPVVTGIKPNDIIFIPSLTGKYMEDWIVQSVGYEQDGGKISLNISATRPYGLGNAMQQKVAQEYLDFANENGLLGSNATLEAWTNYAWPPSLR